MNPLDLLEYRVVLGDTHSEKFLTTVVLVQHIVGVLPELLHESADKHLAQFHEVAVVLIVHLHNTPRVGTSPNLATIWSGNLDVGTHDSKWNLAGDFLMLGDSLVIFVFVSWRLENPDVVMFNVR